MDLRREAPGHRAGDSAARPAHAAAGALAPAGHPKTRDRKTTSQALSLLGRPSEHFRRVCIPETKSDATSFDHVLETVGAPFFGRVVCSRTTRSVRLSLFKTLDERLADAMQQLCLVQSACTEVRQASVLRTGLRRLRSGTGVETVEARRGSGDMGGEEWKMSAGCLAGLSLFQVFD